MKFCLPIGLITALLLCGCAAKKPVKGIDYLVPRSCLTHDPILEDCTGDPPQCRTAIIVYHKGCEVLKVKK